MTTKITNYERIKNMSIEEMAEFLNELENNCCEYCTYNNTGCEAMFCFDGHLEWLKQEVTNDN